MKQKITLIILICLFGLLGCNQKIDKPIVPNVSNVKKIEIFDRNNKTIITDKSLIREILVLMNKELKDWYRPFDTYPTPIITAKFISNSNTNVFVLYLGENWIGGDDEVIDSMNSGLVRTNEETILMFKEKLGLKS